MRDGRGPRHPVVYYSPPLRRVDATSVRWTYQTLVAGADGVAQLIAGTREWPADDGRAACARHLIAQMRVDREAARASQAEISIVAVVDPTSWDDLKRAFGLPTAP
jgi:hypothetical protein